MKLYKLKLILGAFIVMSQLHTIAQWQVTGNGTPAIGPNNFLGTNNLLRMRLNQSITNTLNGFSTARDGYLLLGNNKVVGRLRVV